MNKRFIFLVLVLVAVFSLSACGSKESAAPQTDLALPQEESAEEEDSAGGDAAASIGDIAVEWKYSPEYMSLVEYAQTLHDNTDAELNISLFESVVLHISNDETYYIELGQGATQEQGTFSFTYDANEKANILVLSSDSGSDETYIYKNKALYLPDTNDPQWVKVN